MNAARVFLAHVWSSRFDYLILSLLGCSLALNVTLGWKLQRQQVRAIPEAFQIGKSVPTLNVQDSQGAKATLNWVTKQTPTLVYVFSPSCHWCTRNLPNIKTLTATLMATYRVVGISLSKDDLDGYLRDNHLGFPVYLNPSELSGRPFTLTSTPQTVVISPLGIVTQFWNGAYIDRIQRDIEAQMGLHLPGLAPEAKTYSRTM